MARNVGGRSTEYDPSTGRSRLPAWDPVLAVVLLVVLGVFVFVEAAMTGMHLYGAKTACHGECDLTMINIGAAFGMFGPVLVGVASLVLVIVRLTGNRSAWRVPLLAIAASLVMLGTSYELITGGMSGT